MKSIRSSVSGFLGGPSAAWILPYAASVTLLSFAAPGYAGLITDADFSTWSFGATGTATVTHEAFNGNPGARLNITTVSGPTVYGTAIKSDFSSDVALAGAPFTLMLDVLSGPGAFREGQRIQLLVEQNATIYGSDLGITGFPHTWDTLTFNGSFTDASFTRLVGPGPAAPDFSGGTMTRFGFAGGNTNSLTLTQYYDNFSLESSALQPVPEPSSVVLLSVGLGVIVGVSGVHRRRERLAFHRQGLATRNAYANSLFMSTFHALAQI